MAQKSSATSATFQGVRNGRPSFDWKSDLQAPAWLVKLANAGNVRDGKFYIGSRELAQGQSVSGQDNG